MITRKLNGHEIPALGLGGWAIGGPFFGGDMPAGWGEVDDAVSTRAIACAVDHGIRFFDTAQAYGTGHSEKVLGTALRNHPEVMIGTKIGYAIDPVTRKLTGEMTSPADIATSIEDSLRRLQRDTIDHVHLHLNELTIDAARPVFELLATLRTQGKIRSFGWSTDFPDRAAAFADQDGFVSIQHAMNVFFRADRLMPVIETKGLLSINRSPLAMGLLGGRYDRNTRFGPDEIRGQTADWMAYFSDGRIKPDYADRLAGIRDSLQVGGRSLAQGALCWLWARSARTLPIPGFRTEQQVKDLAGALAFGPLPAQQMADIEKILARPPEGEPRSR
jgi:aryl-alcohol dehydrogenase-like predicted oxidoreductase